MREIKFRAWHNIDGWCGAFSVHQTGLIDYGSGWMTTDEANMILMQYTGLKDKNRKEIYEGDIVMFLDRDWIDYEADTKRLPVVYENDAFVLKDTKPDRYGEFSSYSLFKDFGRDRFEVIGNIYENPELMEI